MPVFATHPIVRGMSLILYATLSMTIARAQGVEAVEGKIEVVATDYTNAVIARAHVRVVDHRREQTADGVTDEYGRFLLSGLGEETYTVTTTAPGFLTSTQDISIPRDGSIRVTTVLQIAQKYTEVYEGPHLPVDTRSAEIVANQPTLDLYRRSPPLLDVEIAQPVQQEQRSPRNNLQRFFSTLGRKLGL